MSGIENTTHRAVQILRERRCCGLSNSSERMIHLLNDIEGLTSLQKNSIITRYISLMEKLKRRTRYYSFYFHVGRTIVTVGSLIVPALLSIQYNGATPGENQTTALQIYWITWFVSLLVTTCNGVLTLFKIDKKYYLLHTISAQLESEVWNYIYLSGKYSGFYGKGKTPSHHNQYVIFCHNMEKIKLKQVEEEYYKATDHTLENGSHKAITHDLSGNTASNKIIAGLYHPTPDMDQLLSYQQDLAKAIMKPKPSIRVGNGTKDPTKAVSQLPETNAEEDKTESNTPAQAMRRSSISAKAPSLPATPRENP